MIYLDLNDLLVVAERAMDSRPEVRDLGLLHASAARPAATFASSELYPPLQLKAAALVHSLAKNHALVDGNKRLALASLIVFLGVNGRRLTMTEDAAFDFITDLASGVLDDVSAIAEVIDLGSGPR